MESSKTRRTGPLAALAAAALTGCAGSGLVSARSPAEHPCGAPSTERAWTVDPDARLPAHSPWRPVLGVARRFARAYLSYEVAAPSTGTRRAITASCTAGFARLLLSHPAVLPPGVRAAQVRQVLVDVTPLAHAGPRATVLAAVRAARRGGPSGAFELVVVRRAGRPRVAAMAVY